MKQSGLCSKETETFGARRSDDHVHNRVDVDASRTGCLWTPGTRSSSGAAYFASFRRRFKVTASA